MAQINNNYKKHHKPVNESKSRYHQGYYIPKHPEKCLTKENIYRSGWEVKFFRWCDENSNVVRWASEPVAIKYKNPISNLKYCLEHNLNPKDPRYWKTCNYYTDVWIELKTKEGNIRKIFIEIKPYSQTIPPKPINENAPIKEHKAYNRQAETYLVNQAKWQAAVREFAARGCEFMIVTEKSLSKLGLM